MYFGGTYRCRLCGIDLMELVQRMPVSVEDPPKRARLEHEPVCPVRLEEKAKHEALVLRRRAQRERLRKLGL